MKRCSRERELPTYRVRTAKKTWLGLCYWWEVQVVSTCIKFISNVGLVVGGTWGLYEGVTKPEGRTSRLRMNSILNGLTRRGPFMANTAASLGESKQSYPLPTVCYSPVFLQTPALMYSPLETAIGRIRGVEDNSNSIAAAGITGLLYKSTGE